MAFVAADADLFALSETRVRPRGDTLSSNPNATPHLAPGRLGDHQPPVRTNALDLQRGLGLGSYQTAWAWLHEFRRAMVRPGHDRLSGRVEAGQSHLGGPGDRVRGRGTASSAVIAIAVEANHGKIGRARLQCPPHPSPASLTAFLSEAALPGSVVDTDGSCGHEGLADPGFDHEDTPPSVSSCTVRAPIPCVHRVAPALGQWTRGALRGGIAREHLPYYLDEFTFRFNYRSSRAHGLLFYHLLEQAIQSEHTPTARLYKGTGRGPRAVEARQLA